MDLSGAQPRQRLKRGGRETFDEECRKKRRKRKNRTERKKKVSERRKER
jgi:hypothetical protein